MTVLRVDVNTVLTREELLKYRKSLKDLRGPFRLFKAYMSSEIEEMFDKVPTGGGTARGVYWPGFADQYTRKDGTVIPAEGGVPKVVYPVKGKRRGTVRGSKRRKVLGRKRHSRSRVTQSSKLMMDHGTLAMGAASRGTIRKKRIEMRPSVTRAAHQDFHRPFMFYTDGDINYLRHLIIDYVEGGDAN